MQWKYHNKLTAKIVAMTLCFSLIPLFTLGATRYYLRNRLDRNPDRLSRYPAA